MKTPTVESFGEHWSVWDDLLHTYCLAADIPVAWLKAICMIESSLGLNPRVARGIACPSDIEGSKSEDGLSWGLLQLQPSTARDFDLLASPERLNDPAYSICTGAKLMQRLCHFFQNQEEWCVKAWNQGARRTQKEKDGKIDGKAGEYWEKYRIYKGLIHD